MTSALWVATVLTVVAGAIVLVVAARPPDCTPPLEVSQIAECTEVVD